MESKDQDELIRIVYFDGKLACDFEGRAEGRGSYLCRAEECWALAEKKNSFARSYRRSIPIEDTKRVIEEIRKVFNESKQ